MKNILKKVCNRIKYIYNKYKMRDKLVISLFLSAIIFSVIGTQYTNSNILYYVYLLPSAICLFLFLILLPVDKQIKNKIRIRLVIYPAMALITLLELVVYGKIYFGYEIPILLHIVSVLVLVPDIIFFIDVLECLFKFISSIINIIVKETNSKFINILKNITSIIITITTFCTAIISFAKLFSEL